MIALTVYFENRTGRWKDVCERKRWEKKKLLRYIPGILALETRLLLMPCSALDKNLGLGVGHRRAQFCVL